MGFFAGTPHEPRNDFAFLTGGIGFYKVSDGVVDETEIEQATYVKY